MAKIVRQPYRHPRERFKGAAEAPVAEAPVAEEPVAEEPVAEESAEIAAPRRQRYRPARRKPTNVRVDTLVSLALLFFGGLQLSESPSLFVADLVAVSTWALIFFSRSQRATRVLIWITALTTIGVGITAFLDAKNGLATKDMISAASRNGIFASCAFGIAWIGMHYGLRPMIWCYVSTAASLSFFIITMGQIDRDFSTIVKYGGFSGMVAYAAWFFSGPRCRRSWSAALLSLGGVVFFVFAAARGAGAILLAAGFIGLWKIFVRTAWQKTGATFLGMLLTGAALPFIQDRLDESEARNDYSNEQRLRMARDAWVGFKEHPIFGHGTFSHAAQYTDVANPMLTKGVHSVILQFGYEYGFVGMGAGVMITLIGAFALLRVMAGRVSGLRPHEVAVVCFAVLSLIYDSINSPFFTVMRILLGMELGICIVLITLSYGPIVRDPPRGKRAA